MSAHGKLLRLRTMCGMRSTVAPGHDVAHLRALEAKTIWLSTYMIHQANNVRPKRDGLKVGGHQASSTSLATIMNVLYFKVLQPQDRVAVKPHASPMYHAIQYLFGNQTRDRMERFRALGGVQAYPSRTKDVDDVDFSTGSVGLGAAVTTFGALSQDYLRLKPNEAMHPVNLRGKERPGRMVALVGDAEMDEGVSEVLLESWKHKVKNNWWIIDYNRQSLDKVIEDNMVKQFDRLFRGQEYRVVIIKYGKKLLALFDEPGGRPLKRWFDGLSNDVYSALTFHGGAAFRKKILKDLAGEAETIALVQGMSDQELGEALTNLGGHDIPTLLEAFAQHDDDESTVFICYTIKGYGLQLAGHRDNHGGFLNQAQMDQLQTAMNIDKGLEWDKYAGLHVPSANLQMYVDQAPFASESTRSFKEAPIEIPAQLTYQPTELMSTQEAFGKIMLEIGRSKSTFADRVVTAAPDVATSTNLSGWVNQRGVFGRNRVADAAREHQVPSALKWEVSPRGQHIELGIAENNLFLLMAALGLSTQLFGRRLFPVGTLYDPFIARGLDSMNYACYQDARFMVVATPSGISLAPEGGAHQSIYQPLIGMGQPNMTAWEPAYADELAVTMRQGFELMQQPKGSSVYLRLSTRTIPQPKREMTAALAADIIEGAYWAIKPTKTTTAVIAYSGVVAPEVLAAAEQLREKSVAVLAITSPGQLFKDWRARTTESKIAKMLASLPTNNSRIVTVQDAHPGALAWLGSVVGHRVVPLGVTEFGQSGDIPDLYAYYKIDTKAIVTALQ